MNALTINQFKASVESGGVVGAVLRATGASFFIVAETRKGEAVLVGAKNKEPRPFANLNKAMLLLREFGIVDAKIDGKQWQPEMRELTSVKRPDVQARMKTANEVSAAIAKDVNHALQTYQAGEAHLQKADTFFKNLKKSASR
jgi:hypothetical protein